MPRRGASGGAFIVRVTWWWLSVTAGYSLFSVIADWAAVRSTMALLAA